MRQQIRQRLYTVAAVAGVVGVALAPLAASAISNTGTTTVRATIASGISLTTSGTVVINITPAVGGSQSSASDTVTVSTNNATGYNLKLEDNDTTYTLGTSPSIAATANTYASPTSLANNTWGWAVAALGTFDASYSALSNVTSSATKWAVIPASGSGQQIKNLGTATGADTTTVWYSAKADGSKAPGNYDDVVLYTATTNP